MYGPTSKRSATNAATMATSLIGTGERVKIYESLHFSMAATLVYLEMVLISLEETLHACPLMIAASSVLNLLMVEAASLLVLSKSRLELSSLFLWMSLSIKSFANVFSWTIHLGPVQTVWKDIPPNPQPDGLGYNPRCLSRELNPQATMNTTENSVVSLILNSPDIANFQDTMQYVVPGDLGVHGGGHYAIGGDANGDLFNSPSDPAFFAHHSMIDLVWWTWQSLGLQTRQNAIAGTITFMNNPPSRNTTLDDMIDLGYAGAPNITIGDTMNTLAGPFCYVYA
jgi:hypothetical protein